ncbi:putative NFACT, RNA-binding domain-containing protein [Plasmopara halstedii]
MEKQQTKRNEIYQRRKTLWFEKFHWLLISEKYFLVAGNDAHQNELLVKRYLRKWDVYVHADLHGAATCIVRNHVTAKNKQTRDVLLIPVATLEQAGCMSVCRSSAWSNQIIAGAYWVHADQVSKTAPTGEYPTTSSFMVRGKKSFIQPLRLKVGLAIFFPALLTSDGIDEAERGMGGKDVYSDGISTEKMMSMTDKCTTISQQTLSGKEIDHFEKNERRDEDAAYTQQTEPEGKKRFSAKVRRDMKKGKTYDEMKDKSVQLEMGLKIVDCYDGADEIVLGKRGKMKKMKKKYADQDDEDRRLRTEALGHVAEQEEKARLIQKKAESFRQQREKIENFLDELQAEAENIDYIDTFTGESRPNDIALLAIPMWSKEGQGGKPGYNLKEEKNTNRPMSDAHDDCQPDVDPVVVQREHMRSISENELI